MGIIRIKDYTYRLTLGLICLHRAEMRHTALRDYGPFLNSIAPEP